MFSRREFITKAARMRRKKFEVVRFQTILLKWTKKPDRKNWVGSDKEGCGCCCLKGRVCFVVNNSRTTLQTTTWMETCSSYIISERHGVGKTRMGDEGGEDTHPNTPEKKEIDQRSSSTGIEKTEPAWAVRRHEKIICFIKVPRNNRQT